MQRKPARIISRPLVVLLSVAAALVVVAIVVAPVIDGMAVKAKTDNVLLIGVPFILIFVAIVLPSSRLLPSSPPASMIGSRRALTRLVRP